MPLIPLSRRSAMAHGLAILAAGSAAPALGEPADPLADWNAGPAKQAIVSFVGKVMRPGGPDFVPVAERIAVFDNDGTLWAEQPMYFQGLFALDRARELIEAEPSLAAKPPFQAIAAGDTATIARFDERDVAALIAATHSGMSPDAFNAIVAQWMAQARHPRFKVAYDRLIYAPQLQLLAYLRGAGFKTYIVSGGGVDFMRAFAERAYGIPPEQVIGSSGKTKFTLDGGKAGLLKTAELGSIDDKEGKPQNIELHIGRRPIVAVGNSDGDLAMLQYAASGARPNLEILIHHDDAAREYAYDRGSKIGALDKAWDEATARGWTVVSMQRDWARIFP